MNSPVSDQSSPSTESDEMSGDLPGPSFDGIDEVITTSSTAHDVRDVRRIHHS